MKKLVTILAVAMCSMLAMAQTNQYFWAGGQFIMGNPINQVDSITFGVLEQTDSILLYLPRTIKIVHDTIIQKEIVHDTVNIYKCINLDWSGLTIEAIEPKTVIKFNIYKAYNGTQFNPVEKFDETTIPGNLYYSFDAKTWQEWNCYDSIVLSEGQRICIKGNRPYYGILDRGMYYLETITGAINAYGYISSLFDNGEDVITTEYPDCALACNAGTRFFAGNCSVTLSFPEGVTKIGTSNTYSYAFASSAGSDSLGITNIELPSTITLLGGACFEGAQMKSITIPHSMQTISNAAFNKCTQLIDVTFLGTIEEWNAINKGNYKWQDKTPASVVHCTDGDANF